MFRRAHVVQSVVMALLLAPQETVAGSAEFAPAAIEDYAVFSAVLEQYYPLPNVNAWGDSVTTFICRKTTRWAETKNMWPSDPLKLIRSGPYPGIDSLAVEVREDFVRNNQEPVTLDPALFRPQVREEPEALRSLPADYWKQLAKGWPEVWGVIFLSSVGYSPNGLEALVIVGFGDSAMSGSTHLYQLHRADGAAWRIQRRWMVSSS